MNRVRIGWIPKYSEVRAILPVLNGTPQDIVVNYFKAIYELRGTPQSPVDWSDPDTWIDERLSGDFNAFARRVWEGSQRALNPRYIDDPYRFSVIAELISTDGLGIHRLTARGAKFIDQDAVVIRAIDEDAAIPDLLGMLTTTQRARIKDLLPEWSAFMRRNSSQGSESSLYTSLRQRLHNLEERGLVTRDGNVFEITPTGTDYASALPKHRADPKQDLLKSIQTYNRTVRHELRERLATMDPYRFEQLVRDLLQAMGYDDVEVTKESGDKGVDVVATVQFGITTITEVVQVKRHQGSITRPVLDQLRGVLPLHKAIRGTIITTGTFSKGLVEVALFQGAAPIGLIDGEKLLDLLIENEIGIRKRPIEMHDIDESAFIEPSVDEVVASVEAGEQT